MKKISNKQLCVLQSLEDGGPDQHAAKIYKRIYDADENVMGFASCYTILDRFARDGLVSERLELGERGKRFFTITPEGLRLLEEGEDA